LVGWDDGGMSVHIGLGAEVVQNLVRRGGETTSGSEVKVGGDEKIGEVLSVDFAGDGSVVARGAGILEYSAVVGGVDPD
jgi:hypothetical protein